MELNEIGKARLSLIGDAKKKKERKQREKVLRRKFIHVEKCLLILPDDGTTLNYFLKQ